MTVKRLKICGSLELQGIPRKSIKSQEGLGGKGEDRQRGFAETEGMFAAAGKFECKWKPEPAAFFSF